MTLLVLLFVAAALAANDTLPTGGALDVATVRCYRFDLGDEFEAAYNDFNKKTMTWTHELDVINAQTSHELDTILKKYLCGGFLRDKPSFHPRAPENARAAKWMEEQLHAARPDLDVTSHADEYHDGWSNSKRRHYIDLVARYPVNETVMRAVRPLKHTFIERWTDAQRDMFERYGFTAWHFERVPCP